MSYSFDKLLKYKKNDGGYAVSVYLEKDNPRVTEVKIPKKYKHLPVVEISNVCFEDAKYLKHVVIPPSVRIIGSKAFSHTPALESLVLPEGLELIDFNAFERSGLKSITLPKSLKELHSGAFQLCGELERVEFGGSPPVFGHYVFRACTKLPPEIIVMGIVRSPDITKPLSNIDLTRITEGVFLKPYDCFRADVFEILAKNNCFRNCDLNYLFRRIFEEDKSELIPVAAENGLLEKNENAALVDRLIEYSSENHKTETTAFLLEYKRRNFGFKGGDDLAI